MPFTEVTLNDGRKIPAIGFGTWKVPNDVTAGEVDQAIDIGFDHIDTAQAYGREAVVYGNETQVGQAIKQSALPRTDIWSILESLDKLGLEYVDLYLIHHPRLAKGDIRGTWEAFEGLKKEGFVKSIGVSNFTKQDLQQLLTHATIPPAVNQILLHPYVISTQAPLLAYLSQQNIVPEGYSSLVPLTSKPGGPVDKPVREIAERLGKEPEQVLLAWSKAKGAVIVTTSSKKSRLESYLSVGDITLSPDDVRAIDKAGIKGQLWEERKERLVRASKWAVPVYIGFWVLFKAFSA
ncbi:hypothetical protein B9479_004831 [Cryptococcus floricola]|uniref:NADP-dependent oxidoreductase domain-containing protein n=1 Tax=Cryptococcus floricola TaxID=2591691 RepID=A0A5D3ASM6_9TREE|nr:hypothetical protein B9479_004831 [Cryptococcus floricola]